MRRLHVLRASALAALGAAAACASVGDTPEVVRLSPTLLAPRGVLTGVTRISVAAYEASDGWTCDPAVGQPAGGGATKPIASAELTSEGCSPGLRFCGSLELSRSPRERIFAATAFAGATTRAVGCATATADQEALPLEIRMVRSVPPSVCGDGVVQATEQCDPAGSATDPLCDAECHTKEVLLSGGNATAGTVNGRSGEKVRPSFVWRAQSDRGGKFVAFFGDRTPPNHEIAVRVLSDSFGPYSLQGPAVQDGSFFLPNNRGVVLGNREAFDQTSPAATSVGSSYYVAFEDTNSPTSTPDIHLRSLDDGLAAQEPLGSPIGINGTNGGGEPGSQTAPAMAVGASGALFIVWQDDPTSKIVGRTLDPQSKALGAQVDISQGPSNRRPSVAGRPGGWVVVWEGGTDVKMRLIGASGAPTGLEQTVNDPSHRGAQRTPAVAALPDGRFVVAWSDAGNAGNAEIFAQRYDASGAKIPGDQTTPVNDVATSGDQTTVAAAAVASGSGAYALAWLDETSGHVRARFLGGTSGFLFNNVDGQSTEFQASVEGRRTRGSPALAVGGAGPFVAIGWEDRTGDARAGIYARRFPVPTE